MDSQLSGIDKWAAGIRFRMANDPGRQDLDDHILCNGFLFLDEYLEDILTGARTEPIIELTKTPGRRKETTKKVRATATVTMDVIPFAFKLPDTENIPIANSPAANKALAPHNALFKASKENQPPKSETVTSRFRSPSPSEPRSPFGPAVQSRGEDLQEAGAPLITPALNCVTSESYSETPQLLFLSSSIKQSVYLPSPAEIGASTPSQEDITRPGPQLSIIAEDDEAETSQASNISQSMVSIIQEERSHHIPTDPCSSKGTMTPVPVPRDLSAEDDDTQTFQTPYDRSFNDSEPTSTASSFSIDPYARDYETHELRYLIGEQTFERAPSPHLPPAQSLVRKASVPVLPSLPGPSPLRKSTHEPLGNAVLNSAVTGKGTRTSWLNKTRDVTTKRISVVNAVKRKSVDPVGESSSMAPDDAHSRATKIAKTEIEDTPVDNPGKNPNKLSIQPFRPVVPTKSREVPISLTPPVVTPDDNSDGMVNLLKRTVEGLGARVGKSMGRSLGGAAATAAAAEAKAAAEARLAQREAHNSDGNRQSRLSVSDLIGVYDGGKGKCKAPSIEAPTAPASEVEESVSRASGSTTPSHSPPSMRNSPPLEPIASATATSIIPKFTVQRHSPIEPSFTLPDSQPSTQSTYVSSIFDDQSAWPPSAQTTIYAASEGCSQTDAQGKDVTLALDRTASVLLKETSWIQDLGTKSNDIVNEQASQSSFVAQASGLLSKVLGTSVGSTLGTSKRGKAEPVKSIQLAAVAAKKQQEEADRKAARLREMDKRRAAIASKKAEQEAAEKVKQQGERRKREREEGQEKKVTRATVKKEEEVAKKRKVVVEIEKKPENKKPTSKDKKDLGGSRIGKPVLSSSQSQIVHGTLSKSFKQPGVPASASESTVKLVGLGKGEIKSTADGFRPDQSALEDVRQPSQALHAQMQARVEAQLFQARQHEPLVPSESIELPEINSEYSNSDDEDRPRTFDPPGWAQSPDLRLALESQSRMNPDDIFGPVRPLRMEEIFPTRQSRFRARTSSANWAGTDEVTRDEEAQYAKRMGYLD